MVSLYLLYQSGFFVVLLVLGLIMGLSFKNINFSKKVLVKVYLILTFLTFLVFFVVSLFKSQLIKIVPDYSILIFFVVSLIMLLSGGFLIKNLNNELLTKQYGFISITAPYLSFLILGFVCISSISSFCGLDIFKSNILFALLFTIVTMVSYYLFNRLDYGNYNSMANLILFLGILFMVISFLFPNIISMVGNPIGAISIASVESLILATIFLIAIIVLGIFYFRKNSFFK